jgi:hypothetical protein
LRTCRPTSSRSRHRLPFHVCRSCRRTPSGRSRPGRGSLGLAERRGRGG